MVTGIGQDGNRAVRDFTREQSRIAWRRNLVMLTKQDQCASIDVLQFVFKTRLFGRQAQSNRQLGLIGRRTGGAALISASHGRGRLPLSFDLPFPPVDSFS